MSHTSMAFSRDRVTTLAYIIKIPAALTDALLYFHSWTHAHSTHILRFTKFVINSVIQTHALSKYEFAKYTRHTHMLQVNYAFSYNKAPKIF